MGYKIQFETGHTVEFDSKPSDADIEEAYNSVKGSPAAKPSPQEELNNQVSTIGKSIVGAGEAGAGMLAGLPSQIYGGLMGVGSILKGEGVDKAVDRMEEELKSNFGTGEYKPATETGKKYHENVGKFFALPGEYAGKLGEKVAGSEGRFVGELLANTAMNFVDPLLPYAAGRGAIRAGKAGMDKFKPKADVKPASDPIAAMDAELAKRNAVDVPMEPQQAGAKAFQEINDRLGYQEGESSPLNRPTPMQDMAATLEKVGDTERASNADAAIARRTEIETDAVKRQTALDQQAAERQRQENAPTGYEEIKAAEEQAKATAEAEMKQHQAKHEALLEEQRQLDASKATEEVRAQAQETINQRERQLQADVQRTVEQARKNAEDIANRRAASQTASEAFNIRHERAIQESVDNHPFLKAAEDKVDQLKLKLTALEEAVANGETNAVALVATRNALKNAIGTREKVKKNLTGQARSGVLPKPQLGKQKGVVNPEVFKEGFSQIKRLANGLVLKALGDKDYLRITVDHPKHGDVGGAIYKKLDKWDKPENTNISSTATGLTPNARGQGIPKEIYKFAAELGNDVVPDKIRTEAGKNMWNGFEKSGLSQGMKIPAKQRGAILIDPRDNIKKNKSDLYKAEKELADLGDAFWIKRTISEAEYRPKQQELLDKIHELGRLNRKWQQTLPSIREEEIHPGFTKIPLNTEVTTNRRGTSERAIVRENRQVQYGDTTTWYPRVEFWDGKLKRLTSGDIQQVHTDPLKKQRGAVLVDWKKKEPLDQLKKVDAIKKALPELFPMEKTAEQLVDQLKETGAKDVDQNIVQRGINHLTKGSLYQAIKTKNPVIQFVGEKFRNADNQIKRFTGELVHDTLAPLSQEMSKKERAEVWALQQTAESKGFTLTPEFMQEHGYNAKQIDWVEGHKAVMKDMLDRVNQAQTIAGKPPISPRVAYLATRARGDFRKLVYDGLNPSGEPKVVGILGDNTRMGLNKQIEQLKAKHPEYTVGEERFYGGHNHKGTAEGFSQMLEFLSENDPKMKEFVDKVNAMISDDAYNFMNAKTHTMNKKGIFGMEGGKLFQDAAKNSDDGIAAQIRYAETIIRWSELSKAVEQTKPLLAKDNGVNMPNAKAWSENYIQGALGNSPGEFGRHLDNATAALGKASGMGVTIPGQVMAGAKKLVNGMLLGFVNVGFNAMNMIQPVKTMPEMAMWLKTKGVDVGVDLGLGRALTTMQKELIGMELKPLEKDALKFAKENHVYSSSLFESGNRVSKDVPYYWDKGTQFIAKDVEAQTRKLTFLSYVHMLNESGVKAKDGLFEAAQNATDIHMNNYAQAEAPKIYQETGAVGRSAYNLMSFKHNELSRTAMLAREIPNNREGRPLLVAIGSQVAFAGIMGTVLYHEADALYQWITSKLGKPTSLTKMLLDNPNIPDVFKYGMGSTVGLDLTNRMGVQVTPGSLVDAVAPGASKVGTMAKAAYQAVTQPNEYNAKNMVREFSPNSVQGIEDRAWFSGKNPMGGELSMNRNKVQANAVRNQTDKLWKTLGLTGVNESKQKTLDYENTRIDQVYKDKRKSIIDNTAKVLFTSGKVPSDFAQKYIAAQGDPNSLARELTAMAMEQKIDHPTLVKLRNAMSSSLTSQHKLLRELGKE